MKELPILQLQIKSSSLTSEEQIKEFYSKIGFPGPYTLQDLEFYDDVIYNPYLKIYDDATKGCKSVLDIGCGSGFITNILARRHPKTMFTAIDFSDSIDYARAFTNTHRTKNIIYYKQDFLTWNSVHNYDLIICNGVLHHIPDYTIALEKMKKISNRIAIGIYNPYGKMMKKIFPIKYKNEILYLDQEKCPFELTFSHNEFQKMFMDYELEKVYPSLNNKLVDLYNVFNYANGGLTLYTWRKK